MSSPFSSHASSRTASLQCHSQSHCVVLGMLSGHAHGFAKTSQMLKPLSGQAQPQLCCTVSVVCVFTSYLSLLTPAPAELLWGEQWCWQGRVQKPNTTCRACPSQGRGLCLLYPPSWFSPRVWLWICGQLCDLLKFLWRNVLCRAHHS